MVKAPVAGRVKSRLARGIGAVAAAAFYRHTVAAVIGRLAGAAQWQLILAVSPDRATETGSWPREIARMPQGGGNLGRRMQRIMDRLPPGPVVIIGSDVPGVRADHIHEAFRALGGHDAVVGPSPDGGYWLVGLRRRPRVLAPFAGVRWSAADTLADTLANLQGAKVALITPLDDVDEAQDLAGFAGAHGRRVLPYSRRR
jgi:rSAM/selenodomain-associated transferase 1